MSIISYSTQLGNIFKVSEEVNQYEKLPVGFYNLQYDSRGEFYYLIETAPFKLPKKLYGDFSIIDRWMKSWKNTEKNMGILLTGIKGSGKTVTCQKLCIESGMPVITVNQKFDDIANLQYFLSLPELQNTIFLFDEFEKHYERKNESLLGLFDGVNNSHILFLLTVNSTRHISDYLINRLNRIRYKKEYLDLPQDVIYEVIRDLLVDQSESTIDDLLLFIDRIGMCTFDLLVSIINEMNLHEEKASEVGEHLCLSYSVFDYIVYESIGTKANPVNPNSIYRISDSESIDTERRDFSFRRSFTYPYAFTNLPNSPITEKELDMILKKNPLKDYSNIPELEEFTKFVDADENSILTCGKSTNLIRLSNGIIMLENIDENPEHRLFLFPDKATDSRFNVYDNDITEKISKAFYAYKKPSKI